jgi:hypothetical protein
MRIASIIGLVTLSATAFCGNNECATVAPPYPPIALAARVEATVRVRIRTNGAAVVTESRAVGCKTNVKPPSSSEHPFCGRFRESAEWAAKTLDLSKNMDIELTFNYKIGKGHAPETCPQKIIHLPVIDVIYPLPEINTATQTK